MTHPRIHLTGLLVLTGVACQPAAPSPSPTVSVLTVSGPPRSAPPRVVHQPDRYRPHPLEARCYDQARAASDPLPAPSPEMRERLDGLNSACRDTHPELPPARFADAGQIPLPECHYGIARIHYHLADYPEAARRFRRAAHEHLGSDMAPFAAIFYLQTLELLGPPCVDLMREDAPAIHCMVCSRDDVDEDLCADLRRFVGEGDEERCQQGSRPIP